MTEWTPFQDNGFSKPPVEVLFSEQVRDTSFEKVGLRSVTLHHRADGKWSVRTAIFGLRNPYQWEPTYSYGLFATEGEAREFAVRFRDKPDRGFGTLFDRRFHTRSKYGQSSSQMESEDRAKQYLEMSQLRRE